VPNQKTLKQRHDLFCLIIKMPKKSKSKGSATTVTEEPSTGLPRTLHFVIRVTTVSLVAIILITCFILFILGILQVSSPNAGAAFPSAQTIHYAYNKETTPCDTDQIFQSHHPLRFWEKFANATDNTPSFEYCGWDSRNTWFRSIATLITMGLCAFLIDRLWRRTPATDSAAIWQKPRRVLKALLIPIGASAFAFFIIMIIDGNDVRYSRAWCLEMQIDQVSIDCDYNAFILTVMFDVMIVLLWVFVVLLMLVRYKWFNKYMQLNEDDYEMT